MDPDVEALAVRILARREHSAAELTQKLRQRGANVRDIECVLRTLADRGWQDDHRFAESLARARADRGFGPLKIQAELQQRGISAGAAQMVVAGLDRDWDELAAAALRKRFGAVPPEDSAERARRSRFLGRRGFSSGQIAGALVSGSCEMPPD